MAVDGGIGNELGTRHQAHQSKLESNKADKEHECIPNKLLVVEVR